MFDGECRQMRVRHQVGLHSRYCEQLAEDLTVALGRQWNPGAFGLEPGFGLPPGVGNRLRMLEYARIGGQAQERKQARPHSDGHRAIRGRASGSFTLSHRKAITDRVLRSRVPSIFYDSQLVDAGGLMSYAASQNDNFRRAAAYVDKILKGAKPGELPIEQPTKFELVINMKTAKAMGFTIPRSILLRADRVIE